MVEAIRRVPARRTRSADGVGPPLEPSAAVIIEAVSPEVNEGRFPAKASLGEDVVVEADVFTAGTDAFSAMLLWKREGADAWNEQPMEPLVNDRWRGRFPVSELGPYVYTIEAWTDPFETWRRDLRKRLDAGQKPTVEYLVGARLVEGAAGRAKGKDAAFLRKAAERLASGIRPAQAARLALDDELRALMSAHADRSRASRYRELPVWADRERARFSAWYEMFPRSAADRRGRHGTFRDVEARLPYVAGMGFDVLYLPPIHPIGRTHRKGRNNAAVSKPADPGSSWAIGNEEGGHTVIHPQLGTIDDFRRLVRTAREKFGIEVALDLAYQCSPDHPYARDHPEWFRRRPDGTIQYAENPPKKYEDIYPFDFETPARQELWAELKSIVEYWVHEGVRIFRVDNPHTKPFAFWEWLIGDIRSKHPDVIFLSEAFTRPKVMYRLAKLGFSQSYTYFAWRNQKWDLSGYMTELTQAPVRDFFRPNFWPNTPDILTTQLQHGGRPAFVARLVLAATLSSNYGIYGPAFELMEHAPREAGSEEYRNSEKYEIKHWDIGRRDSLREVIALVNQARRENPALQTNRNFRMHHIDNDQLICYSKHTDDGSNVVIGIVNLDFHNRQSGYTWLDMEGWGLADDAYEVHDVLTDARHTWHGPRNFVILDPHVFPAHLFVVKHRSSAF